MAKIKAPNKDYTGVSAGVSFVKGEAETDNKWLIGWFKNKGYDVVEEKPPVDEELEALKIKAKELEIKGYANMKKDTLIKKIEEVENQQGNDNQKGNEENQEGKKEE